MLAARLPDNCPALVLNADHRPLSYFPLSLWSWQDTIKAVFLERVHILEEYDRVIHSARLEMKVPSVVSLKTYVRPARNPAFTRFNLFLRDSFACQYCGYDEDLTFDHVIPRSRGGADSWENLVACCLRCNNLKGDRTPQEMGWSLRHIPRPPHGTAWLVRGVERTQPQWEEFLAPAA